MARSAQKHAPETLRPTKSAAITTMAGLMVPSVANRLEPASVALPSCSGTALGCNGDGVDVGGEDAKADDAVGDDAVGNNVDGEGGGEDAE